MAVPTRQTEGQRRAAPVQRWEPFRELEQLNDQFGRLLESVWSPEGNGGGNGVAWIPLADIEETDDAWIIEADVPSVKREDISVELHDNELVISGEIKERERKGVLRRRTRRTGRFEYRVTLPGPADEEKVDAQLHDGVLTVRVPKSERARNRRIEVEAAWSVSSARSERRPPAAPGWRRVGQSFVRDLLFRDFGEALAFVERVAAEAEDHLRRPDMCILDFNRVRLTITNPRHAGVTEAELRLLARVESVIEACNRAQLAGTGEHFRRAAEAALERAGQLLSRERIERIERFHGGGLPVTSVYMDVPVASGDAHAAAMSKVDGRCT